MSKPIDKTTAQLEDQARHDSTASRVLEEERNRVRGGVLRTDLFHTLCSDHARLMREGANR